MRFFVGGAALLAIVAVVLLIYYLRRIWRLAQSVTLDPGLQAAARAVRDADEQWQQLKRQIDSHPRLAPGVNTSKDDASYDLLKAQYAQAILDKEEANRQYQSILQNVKVH